MKLFVIIDIIFDFSSNKATGPSSILMKITKLSKDCIGNNLSVLCNTSFPSGTFPGKLKIANILPIFKRGSKRECLNGRPIFLLSNFDKINEK